ncbi:cell wall anchor protein [Micromonospora sp. NPDC003197]
MIRPKLSLRRPLAFLGAVFVGLTAAVAVAAPASAHHTEIKGTVVCEPTTGKKIITWTVTHSETKKYATLVKVTSSIDTPVKDIQGTVLAPKGKKGDSVSGTQEVPGDATGTVELSVFARWSQDGQTSEGKNKYENTNKGRVNLGKDTCSQAPPPCVEASQAKFKHTFDGPNGVATVELDGELPLCQGVKQSFTLVSYFAPRPEFSVPQYVYGEPDTDTIEAGKTKIELKVELPDCHTQVDLIWGGRDQVIEEIVKDGPTYGNKKLGSPGAPGNRSKGPQGWYNGGTKACQQPAMDFVSNCDGTVIVNLSNNGKISKYAVEFTITAGNFSKKVTVAPNKAESVEVPASDATEIVVSADGMEPKTYRWQRPENCALPTVVVESDCENFTVAVKNPEGVTPATAKIAFGGRTETVTVPAGETKTVKFPAKETGTTATVTFEGLDVEPFEAVYEKPATCGGGGGGLPVTGAAAGGIAAGAVVLLGAGVALFLVARRRRLRFTA